MGKLTVARNAMATRFECVLVGRDDRALRAAGEEALDEIQRIEAQLSLYKPESQIAQINARAAEERVRVSPDIFALLLWAREFWEVSGGSFDPTIAPLVRCWGFMKGNGARPKDEEIAAARALVGMEKVEWDRTNCTIRFARSGMMLDLGSIGKGYALDRAVEILRDAGVENALLHGGTSTIIALGADENSPWKIAIENPHAATEAEKVVAVVELKNESLSVSAIWGKYFELEGKLLGHVIDPRTGWPAANTLLGAVILESATATDALSTAVLLAHDSELDHLATRIPAIRYLQMRAPKSAQPLIRSSGIGITGPCS
jgi:thiamine biosynthesis lipoprotein